MNDGERQQSGKMCAPTRAKVRYHACSSPFTAIVRDAICIAREEVKNVSCDD